MSHMTTTWGGTCIVEMGPISLELLNEIYSSILNYIFIMKILNINEEGWFSSV